MAGEDGHAGPPAGPSLRRVPAASRTHEDPVLLAWGCAGREAPAEGATWLVSLTQWHQSAGQASSWKPRRTRLLSRATASLGASRGLCWDAASLAAELPGVALPGGSGLVRLVLFCACVLRSLMDTDAVYHLTTENKKDPWETKPPVHIAGHLTAARHPGASSSGKRATGVSGQGSRHCCVPHLSFPPTSPCQVPSVCAQESCQDRRAAPAPTEGGVTQPPRCSGLGGRKPPSGWHLHAQGAQRSATGSWSLPLDVVTAW